MKRYLLFSGSDYSPQGGWADFVRDFHTMDEAEKFASKYPADWKHVVDTEATDVQEVWL